MNNEEWTPIPEFNGAFCVSNLGRVKAIERRSADGRRLRERIVPQFIDRYGYCVVSLCADRKPRHRKVHRLVAQAFVPNKDGYDQVNHKDENKQNNAAENLEWCSCRYNLAYGTRPYRVSGANSTNAKLTESDVKEIRANYKPHSKQFGVLTLAQKYGVGKSAIKRVIRKQSYKFVT